MLHECKLSLVGTDGWCIPQSESDWGGGGDQVNINTSDITITIQCDRGRQRATKHLHLAMKGESSREQEGIQLVANAPFVLLH